MIGVRRAVREGVAVNYRDGFGDTGLHWACDRGHLSLVRELLGVPGLDVNSVNINGWTPLMFACSTSSENGPGLVQELLQFPGLTSLNTRDRLGHTAIMWAVYRGYWRTVELLRDTPGLDMETGRGESLVEMAR